MEYFVCRGMGIAVALALCTAGCSTLLGSEAGLPAPKDPGTIIVSVQDQTGRAIEQVNVQVHDIANSVGSTFSIGQRTDRRGLAEFTFIPAGRCRVQVTPPGGYSAGADEAIKPVDVTKDQTVRVAFVLVRN
jgi:hypothetical protein